MNQNYYDQKKYNAKYSSFEPINDPNLTYWQNQDVKDEWHKSRVPIKATGTYTKSDAFFSGFWMAIGWILGFFVFFGIFQSLTGLETPIAWLIYIPVIGVAFYLFRKPFKRYWDDGTGYNLFK